ncbi:ethanolamine utilization protein EutH [Desulfovibrio piger]|uniref:ethanolamine utilization protein EutH n=1 Tax=Desulfovibrio piger TaxID=901 RepID=UPI0026F1C8ED|nr:ethanolamine utilization protein EutH [Desulfovibrio piger]MDD6247405.1 ethanolamine utilization protein EutH [Desulfovibrio piger]
MIVIIITAAFMVLGIVDKLVLHGRLGYGARFDEGIMAMGTLAISMVGIMCAAPLLSRFLVPIFTPVYRLTGGDPAMAAGMILACDTGGYPLACAMTDNPQLQVLSGIHTGAMMGATIIFSIPVSLTIVEQKDHGLLAKGFLAGLIAIPAGCFLAGLLSGIAPGTLLRNLLPLFAFSLLLALGMLKIPAGMLRGFHLFSRFITILIHIFFGAAIIEGLTGFAVIPGMAPIGPQLETVGMIGITLAGAYPMVHFMTTVLKRPLNAVGRLLRVNGQTAAGMVACLANNIPAFGMLKDMDDRGKVFYTAFSVCAAFALGDHLAYAASQAPDSVLPMIAGKILGGLAAILIASLLVHREQRHQLSLDQSPIQE